MLKKIKKDIISIRKKTGESSILAFAKVYLMRHLKLELSKAHLETYKVLHSLSKNRGERFVMAAPRDFGKSTMITLVYVLYCVCYQKERLILLASNTSKQSKRIMDNIKSELLANSLLKEDFPELFEFNGKPKPPRWTRDEIETRTGIKVVAISVVESNRGIRYKEYRPSLIICDDLEKGNAFSSNEAIEKVKDWFEKTILMIGSPESNFIMLGTFFHPYCLIGDLLDEKKHPGWGKKIIAALVSQPENIELWEQWSNILNGRDTYNDKAGREAAESFYMNNKEAMDKGAESIWPQKWSIYQLKCEEDANIVVFSSERQNNPVDPKMQIFKMDELRFYTDSYRNSEELIKSLADVSYYGACDPSTGKGDYSAIIVIARDNETGVLYVIESDIRLRSVDDTINDIIAYARRYHFMGFFVEANVFQQLMVDQLRDRCQNACIYLPVEEVRHNSQAHKKERIQSLHSYTRPGILQLNRNHILLIEQLCLFPRGPHDDGPDATEMLVSNIQNPPPGKIGVSCIKINPPKSPVLGDLPDLRDKSFLRVHNKPKDTFVPDPNDY